MNLHHAWIALRHGGNLVAPAALDALPEPGEPSKGLVDRLRSALVQLDPDKPGQGIGTLLDVVLEDAEGVPGPAAREDAAPENEPEQLEMFDSG